MMRAKGIGERWKSFIIMILDPIIVFLVVVSAGLLLSSLNQSDKAIITFMTILLSISTGLLGSAVSKKWDELTEKGIIYARGASAVRSLKLLLSHVNRLHRKAREYLLDFESEPEERDALRISRIYLRELADGIIGLMEEVLGSIENWTDIVPEAKIETQVGIISELSAQLSDLEAELDAVNERLKAAEDSSQEQIAELISEKSRIERELAKARSELQMKEFEFRPTISSGSILSSDAGYMDLAAPLLVSGQYRLCPHCFTMNQITDEFTGKCWKCGQDL